jgi:3-hydroxyacyl-CoA dehydrogenase
MTNNLAIIAAGAMGSAIARRMAENGARALTSLEGRSQPALVEAEIAQGLPKVLVRLADRDDAEPTP